MSDSVAATLITGASAIIVALLNRPSKGKKK